MPTPTSTVTSINAQCAAQLYDDWRGYYMLRRLFMGAWIDVRPLDRAEALTYRCKADEALELKWEQRKTTTRKEHDGIAS